MKVLKSAIMMLLSVLVIFLFSGCQKDEITSDKKEKVTNEKTTETSSSTISKDNKQNDQGENLDGSNDTKKEEVKTSQSENKDKTEQSSKETETVSSNVKKSSEPIKNQQNTNTAKKNSTQQETNSKETEKSTTQQKVTKETKQQSFITLSIIGSSEKGTIVASTKVEINDGETVLDVTRKLLKEKHIQIDIRGSGASAYVEGIDNLYEFDQGPLSGWTAKKNGSLLDRSVGAITVKNGDTIQWLYTTDYSKDSEG